MTHTGYTVVMVPLRLPHALVLVLVLTSPCSQASLSSYSIIRRLSDSSLKSVKILPTMRSCLRVVVVKLYEV